jgi:hypothetical protein
METKTTEQIRIPHKETFDTKWVKVDDIEQYFLRLSNMGHSPRMTIQIFLNELSQSNPIKDNGTRQVSLGNDKLSNPDASKTLEIAKSGNDTLKDCYKSLLKKKIK